MTPVSGHGLYIALLGIDGIGKSTLADELAVACKRAGIAHTVVSWKRWIEPQHHQDTDYPLRSLRDMWFETFRLCYGGGSIDGGARDLPSSYEDLVASGGSDYLHAAQIAGAHASGPFAASWIELAGNLLLYFEVILPLVQRGEIVIQDSFGYKHVIKELLLTDRIDPGQKDALEEARKCFSTFFGRILAPDLGLLVTGETSMALKWRTRAVGHTGAFEDLSIAGGEGSTFLTMQGDCAAEFAEFAQAYGWTHLEMIDAAWQVNRMRLFPQLRATALGARLDL
jgi:hypothetical protein